MAARTKIGTRGIAAVAGLLLGVAALPFSESRARGAGDPPASAGSEGNPPAASAPAPSAAKSDSTPRQPTAEEVIKALQDVTSPARPVIPPAAPGGVVEKTIDAPVELPDTGGRSGRLLPEGYRLVDRPGRMVESPDGGWMFVIEERGQGALEASLRLLPNRYLEQMERVSEDGTQAVVFIVSGDVTEYRGSNYLLVQKLLLRPQMGNLK